MIFSFHQNADSPIIPRGAICFQLSCFSNFLFSMTTGFIPSIEFSNESFKPFEHFLLRKVLILIFAVESWRSKFSEKCYSQRILSGWSICYLLCFQNFDFFHQFLNWTFLQNCWKFVTWKTLEITSCIRIRLSRNLRKMHVLMTNHEFQSLFLQNYRSEIAIGCFDPMDQTKKNVFGWEVDEFFRCIGILIFRELHKVHIVFSHYPNFYFLRNYGLNFHYHVWYPELQTYIEVREWKVNDVGWYIGNLTVQVFWNTINFGLPRYFNSFFHIYTDFMSCIKMSRERFYLRLTFRSDDHQNR